MAVVSESPSAAAIILTQIELDRVAFSQGLTALDIARVDKPIQAPIVSDEALAGQRVVFCPSQDHADA